MRPDACSPVRPTGLRWALFAVGLLGAIALSGCLVDFSHTDTRCGNGLIDADEACDDGNTQAGDGCDSACLIEAGWQCVGQPSVCSAICSNGVVTENEGCDDGNSSAGDGCSPACVVEPGWQCIDEPSVCSPFCGDGLLVGQEPCDSPALSVSACTDLDLGDGALACLPDCTFDLSNCSIQASCGNVIVEYPEPCDGTALAGESCQSLGFPSGQLVCLPDCSNFDLSDCTGMCGDNVINSSEICDGNDLDGQTCQTLGFAVGTLTCMVDCQGFDTTGCTATCVDNCGESACEGATCGPSGMVCSGGSCVCSGNGGVPEVAEFVCADGYDNDCDGTTDCDDPDCDNDPACFTCVDNDSDGYGVCPDCGTVSGCAYDGDDCCDQDNQVYPGQQSYFGSQNNCSSWDYDCSGNIDMDDCGPWPDSCQVSGTGTCPSTPRYCTASPTFSFNCGDSGYSYVCCVQAYDGACSSTTEQCATMQVSAQQGFASCSREQSFHRSCVCK